MCSHSVSFDYRTFAIVHRRSIWLVLACLSLVALVAPVSAQQIQFPAGGNAASPWNPAPSSQNNIFPPANTGTNAWLQPAPNGGGASFPSTAASGTSYQNGLPASPFPPAGTVGNTTYGQTTITPLGQNANPFGNGGNPALGNSYPSSSGFPNSSGVFPGANPPALFPGNSAGNGSFGGGFNEAANSLYPNSALEGNNWRLGNGWLNNPNGNPISTTSQQILRFFQGPRVRHSYLSGDDDPTSLEINDTDVSLAFAFPEFLGSTQPLYVLPSFSNHLWDGPSNGAADLPGAAYSAFLDAGWESDPRKTFGIEPGVRVGIFSDYETFNSDSFRILGKLLGRVRLTPTATARLGVYYIDRNRIKLVPAGGLFWTPNPDTKFDIFFPEPKLAHYLATAGRTDIWSYVTGYYGGGTWSITRADGAEDSVDINDLRVMLGLEFGKNENLRAGRRLGFVEAGYAFNRRLIYRVRPQDNTDIDGSFALRVGVGY